MKQKKARDLARKGKAIKQVGALPFRRGASGQFEFMLVTSRGTQRFVIPKGWRMRGRPNWQAASLEAKQEAGVLGEAAKKPIGAYTYWKRMKTVFVPITVSVFPIEVSEELADWRESEERRRSWVTWRQARALVDEPDLISLIDRFAGEDQQPAEQLA